MEQTEIILRAIGVLTETNAMVRRIARDESPDFDPNANQLGALVTEAFPTVEVPADAGPAEAGQAVADAYLPAAVSLVGAFAFLFSELAEVHDSGRTDISSADLLQDLALRMSQADDDT
ncbi:hypothetical protein ACFV6E_37040 [Streptomyces sp. NPDC059785]|uniref:hypothetical protein n=1 Tax=unclassified Streptomyces TaxID=2593676 RepID=UPI00365F075F